MSNKKFLRILAIAVLLAMAVPAIAAAQTQQAVKISFFPSKFVCGFQRGNVPLLNQVFTSGPYEQVKPGNYATTFNIFNYSAGDQVVGFYLSLPGDPNPIFLGNVGVPRFGTAQFGCPDIVANVPGNPYFGQFFEGFLLIVVPNANFKVTGVYTFESQNAFERHILWRLPDVGDIPVITHEINHTTMSSITGPVEMSAVEEPARAIAASGAGGLGLGASIDVEWMKMVMVTLSNGEPNPMPIQP